MNRANTSVGFDVIVEPEPIPYAVYMAEMEELHRLIGGMTFTDPVKSRNMLLGYIDGLKVRHGATEDSRTRQAARTLSYAARRSVGIADRTDLSTDQRLEKLREEWAPLLKKPVAKKEG